MYVCNLCLCVSKKAKGIDTVHIFMKHVGRKCNVTVNEDLYIINCVIDINNIHYFTIVRNTRQRREMLECRILVQ